MTMTRLKEAVQHHVQEEETEAWAKMRQSFGDKLPAVAALVEQRKTQLKGELDGTTSSGGSTTSQPSSLLDLTKEELYERAKQAEIPGRSDMNKKQLAEALRSRS